jgi:hypothetical protein
VQVDVMTGTRPGAVRIEADRDRADHFLMRVLHTDPHQRPVPWHAPDIHSITQPIPLGAHRIRRDRGGKSADKAV